MKPLKLLFFCLCLGNVNAQSDFQVESLKTFTKLYGYVRYFYPGDEAASLDWDAFAIYGAGQVEKCKDQRELLGTLRQLFQPIAPTMVLNTKDNPIVLGKILPPKDAKPVYWQHLGVVTGEYPGNIYQSERVNTVKTETKAEYPDFGNVMTYLDAAPYAGKTIKFTGRVKVLQGSTGTGHLWLRVDRSSGNGFFDNMDQNPIRKSDWKQYEIIGNVDFSAYGIALGCFLKGAGELHVDDMHLYYQDGEKWIEIPIKNSNFETEAIEGKDVTWVHREHKGQYDIRIVESESYEGKRHVSIKSTQKTSTRKARQLFDEAPKPGEYINKMAGSGIACMMPLVLYGNKQGTYPKGNDSELRAILATVSVDEPGLEQRLGAVIISWNIFRHFYPYFDVVGTDWESELGKALWKSYTDTDREDFQVTLEQMTAPLRDGHIFVRGEKHLSAAGISWEFIEGQLVITQVCVPYYALKPGDIVTQVNGMAPAAYFDQVRSRISAGSKSSLEHKTAMMSLAGEYDSSIYFTVNGKDMQLHFSQPLYPYCEEPHPRDIFKKMEEGIWYLNFDKIEMKTIDSLMPHLKNARSIICDLRGYPNGNHDFICHLLKEKDDDKWMFVPKYIYPDQENIAGYESYGWDMKPKKPHLDAKIVFITDGRAISYAESFMGFIEGYKLATIVGQPTAGTNGNVNMFNLPGGFSMSFTGMKVLKHDGSQHHGIGIVPDIPVSKTIAGVKAGRDEFLEKAIEVAKGK